MNAQRPSPGRTTAAACGVALLLAMHHAAAQETLVFSAAGLDSPSHTNLRTPILANGNRGVWDTSAKRITLNTSVRLTRLDAVAASFFSPNWSNAQWTLNVFQDQVGLSAEQIFTAQPFSGNVCSIDQVSLGGGPIFWGPGGLEAYTNYRLTLLFSTQVLLPGSYLVSFTFYNTDSIGWCESDINLSSAVEVISPNYLFDLHADFPDMYPTGTPAWDLYGIICPADFNNDGLVEDADFVIFAQAYNLLLCDDPSMPSNCPADLNSDAVVDDADFVLFAAAYDALLCP